MSNISFIMVGEHISLRINSTFYDMFGEYLLFIREVFPEVRDYCLKYGIELTYDDVAYSVPEDAFDKEIILQDFRCIDADRTLFICFRGQRTGWIPSPDDVDQLTVNEYPEIVEFIGNVPITELAIMHALKPFDRCVDGKRISQSPVKHALFYFRNQGYLRDIDNSQKIHYINKSNGMAKEVLDLEIAKAKDLIRETKGEFETCDNYERISIRQYDARWDSSLDFGEMMLDYTHEFEKIIGKNMDYFVNIHKDYLPEEKQGGLCDFTIDNEPLNDVMVRDIINALKLEFPDNFRE